MDQLCNTFPRTFVMGKLVSVPNRTKLLSTTEYIYIYIYIYIQFEPLGVTPFTCSLSLEENVMHICTIMKFCGMKWELTIVID